MSGATSTNVVEFAKLVDYYLKPKYEEEWELSYILLTQGLNRSEGRVLLADLDKLARETFLEGRKKEKDFNPDDPQFSLETFRHDVLHALSSLQVNLLNIFKEGYNPEAYMLLVSEEDVRWEKWREGIEKFLAKEAARKAAEEPA